MTSKFLVIILLFSIIPRCPTVKAEMTIFDYNPFRFLLRLLRLGAYLIFGQTGVEERFYLENLRNNKLQPQFGSNVSFFCNPNGPGARSRVVPQSVHTLRPGDIDIIGAMGDSYTAGAAGMSTRIEHILLENRGIASPIGGQATWRQFFTIPNILKVYNPNLFGYSFTDASSFQRISRFNVAESGAMSRDMPYQAWNLIKRMRSNPNVNIAKHWKMVFYWIGTNDFCSDMCYLDDPSVVIEKHARELTETLRILRDNLPRTMVNVIASPPLDYLLEISGKPPLCVAAHSYECSCFFSLRREKYINYYQTIVASWKEIQRDVIDHEEFHGKNDFTVNLLPATDDLGLPRNFNGEQYLSDLTYLAVDCFHFSQKGYSRLTNALWNNLMEPYGNRTPYWTEEFRLVKCPSEANPYLTTKFNS